MPGFAKVIGDGNDQILLKIGEDSAGNATVSTFAYVDGVGVRKWTTTLLKNETAADDAVLFFNAITDPQARARAALIREKWAPEPAVPDSQE